MSTPANSAFAEIPTALHRTSGKSEKHKNIVSKGRVFNTHSAGIRLIGGTVTERKGGRRS